MKFYGSILVMKKEFLLVLILIIWGVGMIIRTFFGGSGSVENPLIGESTWFVESLTNSWVDSILNSGNDVSDKKIQNKSDKGYTEISVMMPRFFYSAGRKDFAQNLYESKKIYANFKFVDGLQEYQDFVSDSSFTWADLILIPYDWLEDVSAKEFSFQQDLQSAFDSLVSVIVKGSSISFLPFAADPMVSYSLSWLLNQVRFIDISELVYDWTPVKAKSFPLFFGMLGEDYDDGFPREYQSIMRYALLHYFINYNDYTSISTWIDSNVLQSYNKQTLNEILNLIEKTVLDCKVYPSICFQIYNFVWVRFWFLSDEDIVKQYFPQKYANFLKLDKNQMPFSSLESPVRIRWWTIPGTVSEVDTINAAYLFLWEYMNKHSSYNLWNSTLSVFSDSEEKLRENPYIWPRWYVLDAWWNYIKNLRNQRSFWNMIEYKIPAKDYFR